MAGAAETGRGQRAGLPGDSGRARGRLKVTNEGRGASPPDRSARTVLRSEQKRKPEVEVERKRVVRPRPEGGDVLRASCREPGRGGASGMEASRHTAGASPGVAPCWTSRSCCVQGPGWQSDVCMTVCLSVSPCLRLGVPSPHCIMAWTPGVHRPENMNTRVTNEPAELVSAK